MPTPTRSPQHDPLPDRVHLLRGKVGISIMTPTVAPPSPSSPLVMTHVCSRCGTTSHAEYKDVWRMAACPKCGATHLVPELARAGGRPPLSVIVQSMPDVEADY
jgi:hypothetical protein